MAKFQNRDKKPYEKMEPLPEIIGDNKPKKKNRKIFFIVLGIILAVNGFFLIVQGERGKHIKKTLENTARSVPLLNKLVAKEEAEEVVEKAPDETILVKAYKVARRDFEDSLPSLGTVKGYREMDLKFEINGIVDSMNFREGEEVREGDIIASLDQYDALLKLKYAQLELDKTKKFFEIGSIIKNKLEQSELEYESAKSDLDKTYLYAPRDGVLGTRDAEVGEFITTNEKVATLIDDSDVFIELGIVERDIGKVKIGQNAKITVDNRPDIEFKGKVDNVSPVVEGRSRTQTAKIRVNNTKRLLLPGMFARIMVDIFSKENAIVIPNSALNKGEEGYVVYVVHKDEAAASEKKDLGDEPMVLFEDEIGDPGAVEARSVIFEYRSSDFAVIRDGLEEEELVVVETQERLKDKAKVIITEVQEQFL